LRIILRFLCKEGNVSCTQCLKLLSIWHLPVCNRKAISCAFQPCVYFKRQRLHQ